MINKSLSGIFLASLLLTSSDAIFPGTKTLLSGFLAPGMYDSYVEYMQHLMMNDYAATDYLDKHPEHSYFDLFKPSFKCPEPLKRFPDGDVDGGKWTCNLKYLPKDCLIYSIGSEGNYMFEREMLQFGCEIHTFDCFGDYGVGAPDNVTFHKMCVGEQNTATHWTIPQMMVELKHNNRRVDYLKMDVEGAELISLPRLFELPTERLPVQVALEIHPWLNRPDYKRSIATLRQTIGLFLDMHNLGYRIIGREDNGPYACCSEFLFVLPDQMQRQEKVEILERFIYKVVQ